MIPLTSLLSYCKLTRNVEAIERTTVDDGRAVKLRIRSTRESVAGQ
jgi:hypothetical protein